MKTRIKVPVSLRARGISDAIYLILVENSRATILDDISNFIGELFITTILSHFC